MDRSQSAIAQIVKRKVVLEKIGNSSRVITPFCCTCFKRAEDMISQRKRPENKKDSHTSHFSFFVFVSDTPKPNEGFTCLEE